MATTFGFNKEEDVNGILRMLAAFNGSKGRSVIGPSSVRQEARYAKILTLINNSPDEANDGKEATAIEVKWSEGSYQFVEVSDDPVQYNNSTLEGNSATVFSTSNIISKSKMKVDDIVLLQRYPHITKTADWLVVETGGALGTRAYVEITTVTDAATYIGNVLSGPGGETIEEDATILVANATENAFEEGYSNFADFTEDPDSGDRVYYIDGYLLG